MVKRKKRSLVEGLLLPKRKKGKKLKLPKVKQVTGEQIRKSLQMKRELTTKRILESRGSSPVEKERARKILSM